MVDRRACSASGGDRAVIALRPPPVDPEAERVARDLREEIRAQSPGHRQEIVATLGDFQRTLLAQPGDVSRTQNELIEAFGRQLAATQQQLGNALGQATLAQVEQARLARESLDQTLEAQGARQAASLKDLSSTLSLQLEALVRANDQRMGEVRLAVESRLAAIQQDNEKKLEQIRSPSTRSCMPPSSSAWGRSFRRWPSGWSRCTAASARCRSWPATSARSAGC